MNAPPVAPTLASLLAAVATLTASLAHASEPTSGGQAAPAVAAEVLTLDQALRRAQDHNPDLQAARARLDQSKTLGAKAWAGYLPQVNASGSYTYNSASAEMIMPTQYGLPIPEGGLDPSMFPAGGGFIPVVPIDFVSLEIQKRHMFQGNLQVSQNLFAPALIPLIQNAGRALDAATLGLESTRRDILFATAQLYYAAASMREVAEVQKRQLEVTRRHEEDARLKVQQGTAARIVLLRAQIELATAEQDLRRAELSYASSKSALAALLDRDPDFEVQRPPAPQPPEELPDNEADLVELSGTRIDLQAQRKNVEIAEGSRTAVLARYLPNLALFGQFNISNTSGFSGEYGTWMAGVQLSWNLFDGGLREAELRETAARIAESKANVTGAEARARDEARRALLDLATARSNRTRAQEQMRLAEENASLVRTAFEAGAASYLEVLDANAALTGAELAHVSESLNADLAVLSLARAAGLFDPLAPGSSASDTGAPASSH